jgi:hypothetical protein
MEVFIFFYFFSAVSPFLFHNYANKGLKGGKREKEEKVVIQNASVLQARDP